MCHVLVHWVLPTIVDHDSTNFPKTFVEWSLIAHQCLCPMTGWVCQWKPFWIPVDDSFKEAFVEEWFFQVTDTSDFSLSGSQEDVIPETLKVSMPVPSSPWGPLKNEDTACFWERILAPLPPLQPRLTCERLELPFSCDALLFGYEDLVSSGSDQFTMWEKMRHQDLGTTRGWHSPSCRLPWSVWTHSEILFSVTCAEEAEHLQLEPWAPTWKGRCSRNKLLESGISLPCRKLLTMSNTISFMNASTWPTLRAVRFSSTRSPSTLTSGSNRSTYATRSEVCKIILWMGFTVRSFTCLFSSCCSQWSKSFHCIFAAHLQYFCPEERYCQENHPDHWCYYGSSRS